MANGSKIIFYALEDCRQVRWSASCPAGAAVDPTAAAKNAEERASKVVVEDCVQDRIDGGVGVSEPEEEGKHRPWDGAGGRRAPPGHDVDDEEADPHATETRDDNRHAHGGPHLPLFTEEPTQAGSATERQHGRYRWSSCRSLCMATRQIDGSTEARSPRRRQQQRRRGRRQTQTLRQTLRHRQPVHLAQPVHLVSFVSRTRT